jgi:pyridoxal phosphate enzyme (YggS family)
MDAVRTHPAGKVWIARDDPYEPTLARDPGYGRRQRASLDAVPLAHHDHAAVRERTYGWTRIAHAFVIGKEGERRQAGACLFSEAPGQPCQLRPCKVIRQGMSSPPITPDSPAARNLSHILARIEASRKAALKPAPTTTLVAISKTFGPESIRPVIAAGQRVFGENRVQEAKTKWPAFKSEHPDIELHLVGPLQTNKAREAIALCDAIHSLDRQKLAETLRHEFERTEKRPLLFIQVNTGEEPQKAGVFPPEAARFIEYCRETLHLPICGLMCIPPADQPAAPHFALLAKMAREHGLEGLSMGMSADFETAIAFGATHVRIGTAIFGERIQLP